MKTTPALRPFLLTPQEIRVVYAALDLSVAFQNATDRPSEAIAEIRDRFRQEENA